MKIKKTELTLSKLLTSLRNCKFRIINFYGNCTLSRCNFLELKKRYLFLVIIAIVIGIISISPEVKAVTINEVSKDAESSEFYEEQYKEKILGQTISDNGAHAAIMSHVVCAQRGGNNTNTNKNFTAVGFIDVNLNNDGKIYVYYKPNSNSELVSQEIIDSSTRTYLYLAAKAANDAGKTTGTRQQVSAKNNLQVCLTKAARTTNSELKNFAQIKTILQSSSLYSGFCSTDSDDKKTLNWIDKNKNSVIGKYKARFIILNGGNSLQHVSVFKGESDSTRIYIKKIDANTNKEITKVKFAFYNETEEKWLNSEKQLVSDWQNRGIWETSDNGFITINDVPVGKYTAWEIEFPEGYNSVGEVHFKGENIGTGVKVSSSSETYKYGVAHYSILTGNQDVSVHIQNKSLESILIRKRDQITGQGINGVQFAFYNVENKKWLKEDLNFGTYEERYIWTTKENSQGLKGYINVSGVPEGTYQAWEINYPQGYYEPGDIYDQDKKIGEGVAVNGNKNGVAYYTISTGNASHSIALYNIAEVSIKIQKYETDTTIPLKGAEFQIKDETTGKYLHDDNTWTTSTTNLKTYITGNNGTVTISKLMYNHEYSIKEVKAPTGYKIDSTNWQKVPLDLSTKVMNVTKYNSPVSVGIRIQKYETGSDEKIPLKGAEFQIRDDTENKYLNKDGTWSTSTTNLMIYTTGEDGSVRIPNLIYGHKYSLKESKAPIGYNVDETGWVVATSSLNTTTLEVKKYNTPMEISLNIQKYATGTNIALKGAGFEIHDISLDKYLGNDGNWIGKTNDGKEPANLKIFKTDENGKLVISGLKYGHEYEVRESVAPEGYEIINSDWEKVDSELVEYNLSKTVYNNPIATIRVVKKDSETGKGLKGAVFYLYDSTTDKFLRSDNKWIDWKIVNGTKFEPTDLKGFETDENGLVIITGIKSDHIYKVREAVAPDGYEITNENWVEQKTSTILSKQDNEWKDELITSVIVKKVSDKDSNIVLSDAQFNIYDVTSDKFLSNDDTWINWAKDANGKKVEPSNLKIFTTGPDGKFEVTGLSNSHQYRIKEIKAPDGYIISNPNWIDVKNTTILITNENIIVNEQKIKNEDITIEGTVFLDKQSGKEALTNNQYDNGEGLNGIKVVLLKNGKVQASVASGYDSNGNKLEDGKYRFNSKIRKDELSQYSVEFVYNGIVCQSIDAIDLQKDNTSKVKEDANSRQKFNSDFQTVLADTTINNGKSTNKTKDGKDTITYESVNNQSKVKYTTAEKDDTGKAYSNEYYADNQYHISSTTVATGLKLSDMSYSNDNGEEVIKNINCGLYLRKAPDIAVTSDLEKAEFSINGFSELRTYGKRYRYVQDSSAFEITVKASDAYASNETYNTYRSDIQASKEVADINANLYLTYKVTVKNQSGNGIDVIVNDIVDYYSNNLELVAIGTKTLTRKISAMTSDQTFYIENSMVGTETSGYGNSNAGNTGFNKMYVNTELEVKSGENKEFYIQYKVKQDALHGILQNTNGIEVANIVELNAITAKENGKPVPAIDSDSGVGNCVPSKYKETLEDDTDKSPAVTVKITDEKRTASGIVFEDATSEETKVGQERLGDGKYVEGTDKGIKDIQVTLIDVDRGQVAKTYSDNTGVVKDAVAKSGADGKYELSGFIPGNYVIVYTYGNGNAKYTAQQYKSTIYQSESIANTNYGTGYSIAKGATGNSTWYKNDVKDPATGKTIRYSDAIDNFGTGSGIGDLANMYTIPAIPNVNASKLKTRQEIESLWNNGTNVQHINGGTTIDTSLSINAYTPHMAIGINPGAIQNVDFGLVERPRFKVQIDNTINRVILKTADGSILKDIVIDPATGKLKDEISNVKYVPNTPVNGDRASKNSTLPVRGMLELEIDTELIQRSQLSIEYGYKVTNKSEKDYQSYKYYQFGNKQGAQEVKLSVTNILDYVDAELEYKAEDKMISSGLENRTNQNNGWTIIDWNVEGKNWVSDAVFNNVRGSNNIVLLGKGLNGEIASNESKNTQLVLNKTLAPQQDGMTYQGVAEVVEVTKTWGRELSMDDDSSSYGEKLGNLNPVPFMDDTKDNSQTVIRSENGKEPDYHYAEIVTIHPPTGSSKEYNNVIYASIAIVILAIVGGGITTILVKKRKQ